MVCKLVIPLIQVKEYLVIAYRVCSTQYMEIDCCKINAKLNINSQREESKHNLSVLHWKNINFMEFHRV